MKLVVYNPHIDSWYGYSVYKLLTKRKSHRKFWYLLQYILRRDDVIFFLNFNENSCSFLRLKNRFPRMHRMVSRAEFFLWCLLNALNPFRVKYVTGLKNIRENASLFSFTYQNLDNQEGAQLFENTAPIKIFHLTHYMLDTSAISANSKKIGVDLFVAENNLAKHSKYFQKYFQYYRKAVYTLPFVFQPRFQNLRSFRKRKNICLATGTFEILPLKPRTKDFIDFYQLNTLHPMRKTIYENRMVLQGVIDCYISDYHEVKAKICALSDHFLKKLCCQWYNMFFVKQSRYFKFDIVKKYNEYKMFVVPEEANDLPGIGFVEGMACGTAYFGKDDPMYTDLGLRNGIHYIAYDNTLDDLVVKIKFYQNHLSELEKIAQRGYEFVTKNFNGKRVAEIFWNDLQEIAQNPDEARSSFIDFIGDSNFDEKDEICAE